LLRDFTSVKGVTAHGLAFNEYSLFRGELGVLPEVRWLTEVVDMAPRYGRFVCMRLDGMAWPRALSGTASRPLYDALLRNRGHVLPVAGTRGPQHAAGIGSLMGLALEGGPARRGIAPSSGWYQDAWLAGPGLFGGARGENPMPSSMYRAMILIGSMTGATVYTFENGEDLWNGTRGNRWHEAIEPALRQVLGLGLIAREPFVRDKVKVAYQMAAAADAAGFHRNQRDLDEVYNEGLMIRGAHGVEMPGQIPELIPNSGRHYWVPVLSPHASPEVLQSFARVVRPGEMADSAAWTEVLDQHLTPDGMGSAFIASVGRGIFVLNTREVTPQPETFRIAEVPAPVRGFEAVRVSGGTELSWTPREGDVAYNIYRRIPPEQQLVLVGEGVAGSPWTDTTAPTEALASYAVSALTRATEPFEGVVLPGEYLALSSVESRLAEEVEIGTLLGYARSRSVETTPPAATVLPQNWWLGTGDMSPENEDLARAVGERIEAWAAAVAREDLVTVADLYSQQYEDVQEWGAEYARRAFQWFFEQCDFCRMDRQVRSWSFPPSGDARDWVEVVLYARLAGVAPTDSSGRFADCEVSFPRAGTGETRLTFRLEEGVWRIVRSDPALPNMRDLLGHATGPANRLEPGPDTKLR
jgi:hypothetical protein